MTSITSTSTPEFVIMAIGREYATVADERKRHLEAMTNAATNWNIIAPTRVEDFNRANTEFAEFRRVTNTLKRMLAEDGVTPAAAVAALHRLATTELTGQGITRHTSGVSTDADLYERSVWARIFHMTENN